MRIGWCSLPGEIWGHHVPHGAPDGAPGSPAAPRCSIHKSLQAFHEVGFGFCLGEEGSWEGGGINMASFFPQYYYNIEMCP